MQPEKEVWWYAAGVLRENLLGAVRTIIKVLSSTKIDLVWQDEESFTLVLRSAMLWAIFLVHDDLVMRGSGGLKTSSLESMRSKST